MITLEEILDWHSVDLPINIDQLTGQLQGQPKPVTGELSKWLKENCKGRYVIGGLCVSFELEEDAFKYKLYQV